MGINIGFDADGVLFDTEKFQLSEEVAAFMKKRYGLEVVNPDGYGIKDVYGCDSKTEMKFWTSFVVKYSLNFKARPWAKETIQKLRAQGNKVFIITSKACALEKNYRGVTVRFLFELGLRLNGIRVDGIEYCSLENSAQDKLQTCLKRDIKIIVEDKKENIELLGRNLFVLCMDTRNNREIEGENIFRVNDFNDVYAESLRLLGKMKGQENIFTGMTLKSRSEKKNMNVEQRKEYYEWLRRYYAELPFSRRRVEKAEGRIRGFAKVFSSYFKCRFSPKVFGRENIPDTKGIIYVCNHLCNKDMIFLMYALHDKENQWHPLIKKEILDENVGVIFSLGYSVFVDRKDIKSRNVATKELAKLLTNGYNVLIFPEGTYNKTSNNLKDFTGVSHVYLSQVLQKPLMPCALTNDYSVSPILRFGKPYVVPENVSIDEALQDSYAYLSELVEKNKEYSKKRE